ncbi:MAG TPA: class I SAM-dependent methyltransferase [Bryobacteraceae bacterium]|nr:class I SAM-dependent methyltransferase [Bryobacteraceae bacterium]
MIEVKELLQKYSVDDLNRAAEEYFAKLDDHTYHLCKPFAGPEDCPKVMFQFCTLIQGLDLLRYMDVLDFGAGPCWTSHYLTQMGLKVHAVDVSPTALAIGKERYSRLPPIGDQPAPTFSVYDGYRLPFADESMDRIICFDALHHVPNVEHLISEMGRVLRRHGIAGFSEPGPEHSKSDLSQQEMNNHAVLENDIVIEDIWQFAQKAGFHQVELALLSLQPLRVSLPEYNAFLRQGGRSPIAAEVVSNTLAIARANRLFFLHKEQLPKNSSLTGKPLTVDLNVTLKETSHTAFQPILATVTVKNNSAFVWLPGAIRFGGVNLGCHLRNLGSGEVVWDFFRSSLSHEERFIQPGEELTLDVKLSGLAPGEYEMEFDLVSEHVCWFAEHGSRTSRVIINCS